MCGGEAARRSARPGCHEPPSATSPICVAHRAGRLSACACAAALQPSGGYCCIWCELPRRCSVQLLQPVEQWLLGVFRHLSLPLHLSRPAHQSLSGQAGSVTGSGVCLTWHAVSSTVRNAGCAPALCRLADWSQYGWCWLLDRSWWYRLEPSALPLYPHFPASTSHLCLCLHQR